MFRRERLELGDECEVAAERELGVEALLDDRQPQLLETLDLDPRERLELEIRKWSPRPERFGGTERLGRRLGVTLCGGLAPVCRQALEVLEVELARLDAQQVAGRPRRQSWLVARRRDQHLAQAGHLVAQRVVGRAHALVGEELVDQPVARDHPIRVQQEEGQQRALLRPADGRNRSVHADDERTEDPELQARRCHRSSPRVSSSLEPQFQPPGRGWDEFGTDVEDALQ